MNLLTFIAISFFVIVIVITLIMLTDYRLNQERKMLDLALRRYQKITRESNRHRDASEMAATIHLVERFISNK